MRKANWTYWILAAAIFVGMLAPGQALAQKRPAGTPKTAWAGKLVSTEPGKADQKMKMRFEGDDLVCSNGKQIVLSVPLAAIQQVYSSNNRARHPLAAGLRTAGKLPVTMLSNPSGGDGQAEAAILALYMVYGFVPTWGIAAIVHTRERYTVTLVWDEEGYPQDFTVQMSKSEYAAFLPALARVTGKRWPNLIAVKQRLKEEKQNRASSRLKSAARVGPFVLKPGAYQLVLLEDSESEGWLYFIAGEKVNTKRIAAAVPVKILPCPSGDERMLSDSEGGPDVVTVRMADKLLRVQWPAASATQAPDSPPISPEGGKRP